MTVGLSEIAKRARVSPITVSRALRGVGRMTPETRQTIQRIAQDLGYRATMGVLSRPAVRRGRGEQFLRVLAPVFGSGGEAAVKSYYTRAILKGARDRLAATGGEIVTERFEDVGQLQRFWSEERFNGIVLRQPVPVAWVEPLRALGPVIGTVPHDYHNGIDTVYANEHRAAVTAMDHLWECGHREIAWFSLLDRAPASERITQGFDENRAADRQLCSHLTTRHAAWANLALCQYDSRRMPLILLERDWTTQRLEEMATEGLARMLNLRPQPTAVVVSTDPLAAAVRKVAAARGLRLPEDLSIIGYGGDPIYHTEPPQTTIVLPMETIGRVVPELIERRLAMPEAAPAAILIEATLRQGQSVAVRSASSDAGPAPV